MCTHENELSLLHPVESCTLQSRVAAYFSYKLAHLLCSNVNFIRIHGDVVSTYL